MVAERIPVVCWERPTPAALLDELDDMIAALSAAQETADAAARAVAQLRQRIVLQRLAIAAALQEAIA
jgi:hypothetical protein